MLPCNFVIVILTELIVLKSRRGLARIDVRFCGLQNMCPCAHDSVDLCVVCTLTQNRLKHTHTHMPNIIHKYLIPSKFFLSFSFVALQFSSTFIRRGMNHFVVVVVYFITLENG